MYNNNSFSLNIQIILKIYLLYSFDTKFNDIQR